VRGADSVPLRYSAALPALWIAALYDDVALDAVEQRCVSLGHDAFAAARADIAAQGLKATVGGSTVGEIARDLMPVLLDALRRRAVLDAAGRDERVWLEPLAELAAQDRCVADALFEGYDPTAPNAVAEMIRRAEF
jgi:glutamate--cysteine ligase